MKCMQIRIIIIDKEKANKIINYLVSNKIDFKLFFGAHYSNIFEFKIKNCQIDRINEDITQLDLQIGEEITEYIPINIKDIYLFQIIER